MDLARRSARGAGHGNLALNDQTNRSSRPRSRPHPSPSPDRVRARPALPQEPAAPFLGSTLRPPSALRLDRGRRHCWLRLKSLFPTNSTRCSAELAVLVPVFAVLGSHQQGRAVQSLRRQVESFVSRIPPDREETAFLRQAQCDDN